ncbi:hypothetical protein PMAYCL1PPCAC_00507, partial [Pristionchus mayeri]
FEELVRVFDEQPIVVLRCGFCSQFMFTARQLFMHIASKNHSSKIADVSMFEGIGVNGALEKMAGQSRVAELFKQEKERVQQQRLRWSSMSLSNPSLRPTKQFVIDLTKKYSRSNNTEELRKTLLNELDKHIGNAKARSFDCKLIFANAAEYYDHHFTYLHMSQQVHHLCTMLINTDPQKRKAELRRPWPAQSANPIPNVNSEVAAMFSHLSRPQ